MRHSRLVAYSQREYGGDTVSRACAAAQHNGRGALTDRIGTGSVMLEGVLSAFPSSDQRLWPLMPGRGRDRRGGLRPLHSKGRCGQGEGDGGSPDRTDPSPMRADRASTRGNVGQSNLQVLNVRLYMAEQGCKWRALPAEFELWHTVYMRLSRGPSGSCWSRPGRR